MSKNLSPAQEKEREGIYFSSGIKGAFIGLGLGAVATVLTFRRSPEFRALGRPMQSILTASSKYKATQHCYLRLCLLTVLLKVLLLVSCSPLIVP